MKFFLDSANLGELRRAKAWGIIDGVTTNPSLLAKEGVPLEDQIRQICEGIDGDVSAPVLAGDLDGMLAEARSLAKIHKNVVVKIPVTPDGLTAVKELTHDGIRSNVTLCFTPVQALLAAKAGAYLVSPFFARVEDFGGSGTQLISDIAELFRVHSFPTQILAASIRSAQQLLEAAKAGAHIATMPLALIESLYAHPLTDKALEQFASDYNRAFAIARA